MKSLFFDHPIVTGTVFWGVCLGGVLWWQTGTATMFFICVSASVVAHCSWVLTYIVARLTSYAFGHSMFASVDDVEYDDQLHTLISNMVPVTSVGDALALIVMYFQFIFFGVPIATAKAFIAMIR